MIPRRWFGRALSATGEAALVMDAITEGGDKSVRWRGHICWKNPLDLMIYQEIVHEIDPVLVIETGSHGGGSALFWRDMMRLKHPSFGQVISIDLNEPPEPLPHVAGIMFLTGLSSLDHGVLAEVTDKVRFVAGHGGTVLVNLDSDHSYDHVLAELEAYAGFVTPGSYLIVEDGCDDYRWHRAGPHAATITFLRDHPEFKIDHRRERLGLTNCPDGFLRRRVP